MPWLGCEVKGLPLCFFCGSLGCTCHLCRSGLGGSLGLDLCPMVDHMVPLLLPVTRDGFGSRDRFSAFEQFAHGRPQRNPVLGFSCWRPIALSGFLFDFLKRLHERIL